MRVSMILALSALSGLVSAVPMIPPPVRLLSFLPYVEPLSLYETDLSATPAPTDQINLVRRSLVYLADVLTYTFKILYTSRY